MNLTHDQQVEMHKHSLENKEEFWETAADKLIWTKRWNTVLDESRKPFSRWFVGGELNLCFNCVDRHVLDGFGDRTAYIFDSPVTNTHRKYSFSEVLDQVSKFAGVLTSHGVKKGDVVLIYMPMVPEGAFAMLGCARIGAIHACVPGGLPGKDLAQRIDHCKPKIVIAATYGYHGSGWMNYKDEVDSAYEFATHKPQHVIVYQRTHKDRIQLKAGRDLDWIEEMSKAKEVGCVPVGANEPAFMVYTSGSTGDPKGVVHSGASFAVRLIQDGPYICGNEGAVILSTTNFGWIAGHHSVVYGTIIGKSASVIFEGDPLLTEDVRTVYRLISMNQVTRAMIRPGVLKIIKGMDPLGKVASEFSFSSLKEMFVAGERPDRDSLLWASKIFGVSIWNALGQSELVWLVCGLPAARLENEEPEIHHSGVICPGFDVFIMSAAGTEAKPNEAGRILLRLPLPPGALLTLYEGEKMFEKNYYSEYPGFYDTKDEGFKDEKGRLMVENRADEQMKVGLYYISAQAVEEVVMKHKAVSECIVVSKIDLVWKEIPVVLYVKQLDSSDSVDKINRELGKMLISKFGESVKFGANIQVKELPKTRTGKLHRPSCISIVRGQEMKGAGAVENVHVLADIMASVKAAGP